MNLSNPKAQIIFERIKQCIKLTADIINGMPKTIASFKVGGQLMDSITSVGANFIEAQSARSKKEFISIMNIVLREAKESLYWFDIIQELKLYPNDKIESLTKETEQLIKIFASIVITSSKNIR